uniref:HTH cro/C1-type domain-containing protein n=1 Tax=candidate division WOR-3 bacterium TaxID=2052148 RepID=A0A7V3NU23_UNCW3
MIGKILKDLIKKHGVSYRKIAKDLGVDHGNLYRSLKNDSNPEWKTIKKVLDYLGYDFKIIKRREVKSKKSKKSKPSRPKRKEEIA